ncbi:hypothetical protein AZF37_01650 [endosymbiont 'TC1' of Trimyema compressum]|uniref:ATP-binding cassette domain-containing protein n=1 Tax=endosymbiont 'TC1' of Trimyema compressum TaxID=243899 RepID=UPI0007F126CC|nr:ATP-binding cassette domain-containing protein [endosymbiont 'TC1' of Trimyema compressum]AMP20049.1 hypothetical protein AZF37_01650 [endosymbiont 'TC1' of Trimyema compressum]
MYFIKANIQIKQTNVSLDRIYSEFDKIKICQDLANSIELKDNIQKIKFSNINFDYGKDECTLDNFNLEVCKGETVALVGESDCGKSTVLNLLYRLWVPKSGEVLINEKNFELYTIKSIREKICILNQDPLLFNASIRENILLNKSEFSNDGLNRFFWKTGVDLLMTEHPMTIGERGNKLSGGQKQRVAIARAMLSNCDVIIFDESTSSLDNISQKELMTNLEDLFKDKIVIFIAHRMEIAKFSDRIYVMNDGRIIESGTHSNLMRQNGLYKKINEAQI